jgi:uncharacterized Zn-binding protein involved in type VI secretion
VRQPAAKQGDRIAAIDLHVVMVPVGSSLVPTQLPHLFNGVLKGGLSSNVNIMRRPAATVDSTADNAPAHVPTSPGTSFQNVPKNKGKITQGSGTVKINGRPAARNGDTAETCNDPNDKPVGKVVATGTVMIG